MDPYLYRNCRRPGHGSQTGYSTRSRVRFDSIPQAGSCTRVAVPGTAELFRLDNSMLKRSKSISLKQTQHSRREWS